MIKGSTGCNNQQNKVGTTNHNNNNVIDPCHLHGLEQAIYILEQLCGGKEKTVVIREMHGDKQLVDMWANFLLHNYWITFDRLAREWVLTDKGKRWIKQIRKSIQLSHPPSSLLQPLSPLQKQQEAEEVRVFKKVEHAH
jgi:hypothetical protein